MRTAPTLLALLASSLTAQVPITLKAGDKATAAEVMQNFKYLDSLNTQTQKDLGKVQGVVIGNQSDLGLLKKKVDAKLDTNQLSSRLLERDTSDFSLGPQSSSANHLDWFPVWRGTESMLRISGIGSPPNGIGLRYKHEDEYGFFLGNPYNEFSILVNSRKDSLSIGMRGRGRPVNALQTDGTKVRFPDLVYADNGMKVQGALTTSGDVQVGGTLSVQAKQIAPDYVFAPDYPLMPLGELATYVSENRHLPDVPDAGTIATQGVDVAQMNLVLLRKVEELTLHMISLQRQVDSLKTR